jgi:hypothetical protein
MKYSPRLLTLLTLVIAALFLFGTAYAGSEEAKRTGYVDLDGDGFNDNAKDSDGNGIPNYIDENKGSAVAEGSENKGETANAYNYKWAYKHAYKYAEQLKYVHQINHELFTDRKAEFKGDVLENHGSWGDAGEANLNPEWSDESGPTEPVGHKGSK